MRTAGSLELVEYRRHVAVRLLEDGLLPSDVADALGASVRSVQRWRQAFEAGGDEGLRPAEVAGRPPKLTPRQEAAVLSWLAEDARAFGFATQHWTAARVGAVIRERFGVAFHPRYLYDWLSRRRVTAQVPEPVSRERDPDRIARWVACDWRRIKRGLAGSGPRWRSPTRPGC
jgi:transposase